MDGSVEFKLDWPKTKTVEFLRSMVKCSFYEKHGIDLTDPHRFPNAKKHFGSFLEKLKSEGKKTFKNCIFYLYLFLKKCYLGRGDTEHHEEIPPDTYEKITKLLFDAMEVLKNRGSENYQEYLSRIPLNWQHRCHQLVQYGAQVNIF